MCAGVCYSGDGTVHQVNISARFVSFLCDQVVVPRQLGNIEISINIDALFLAEGEESKYVCPHHCQVCWAPLFCVWVVFNFVGM